MFGTQHDPLGLKQPQSYHTVQPTSIGLVNATNGSSLRHPSTSDDSTKNRKRKGSSTLNIEEGRADKRVHLSSKNVLPTERNNALITPAPQNIDWSTLSFESALPLTLESMEQPPYSYENELRELDEGIAKFPPSRWNAQYPTPLSMGDSPNAWTADDDRQYTSHVPFNDEPNVVPVEPYQIMDFASYPPSQQFPPPPPPAEPRGPNGWTIEMDNLFQAAHHQVSQTTRETRPHPSNTALLGQRSLPTPPQDVQLHPQYTLIPPPRYTHPGLPAPPMQAGAPYQLPSVYLPPPQQHQHPSHAHPFPSQAAGQHQQHPQFYHPLASQASSSATPLPTSTPLHTVVQMRTGNTHRFQLLLQYPKFTNQFQDRFTLLEVILTPHERVLPRPCPLGANCTAQVRINGLADHIAHFHSNDGVLTCHGHPGNEKELTRMDAMVRHVLQEHWKVTRFECAYCGTRTKSVQGDMVNHWMSCNRLISLHENYRI